MLLDEKVEALARALGEAGLPHAFGGAIALAYYATPRGTRGVDVNVFLPASAFDRVLAALLPLGVEAPTARMRRTLERDGQVRLFWDGTPLDLFFSYTGLHEACVARQRRVAFGAARIAILGPEDLAIFKVLFARDKDWRDLGEMLLGQAGAFETAYALGWLERIVAPEDERLVRFRALVAERAPKGGGDLRRQSGQASRSGSRASPTNTRVSSTQYASSDARRRSSSAPRSASSVAARRSAASSTAGATWRGLADMETCVATRWCETARAAAGVTEADCGGIEEGLRLSRISPSERRRPATV